MKNNIDLDNPDEVVGFIIEFYRKNNIKSEKELVKKLTQLTPLKKLIEEKRAKVR